MNELLQKHGCSNVFTVPEGLKELMADISREVLRIQPKRTLDFIANYLAALLITREHGIMAVKILEDLCDCQPTVSEHLLQIGIEREDAEAISQIIKAEIESGDIVEGKDKIKEHLILKKVLTRKPMDEDMSAKVCQIARNAYKDYCYRKDLLKEGMKMQEEEPWEIAARNTLNLYKKTKPSLTELNRATEKIQAAYRGYHVRRQVLRHLLPKKDKRHGRKVDLTGPPLDVAGSREIDLGPVINIRSSVPEDNVEEMFDEHMVTGLNLDYNPTNTLTHVKDGTPQDKSKKGVKLSDSPPSLEKASPPGSPGKESSDLSHDKVKTKDAGFGHSALRISFSQFAPEIIEDINRDIPEDTPTIAEVPEDLEITEGSDYPESPKADDIQEIPEDLGEFEDEVSNDSHMSETMTAFTDVEDVLDEEET